MSASFDEPNLVGSAGLVPAIALADQLDLAGLAEGLLTVPARRVAPG